MPNRKLTCAFILGLFYCGLLAQQTSHASFLHYTTDQGLSSDNINAICKDRRGFVWIGTTNGLNRFDGTHFKVFRHDPKDDNSPPSNNILGLRLAPNGWLWVSTAHGLCKLDPEKLDFVQIPIPEQKDSLENDGVSTVVFDSKGLAWASTHDAIRQFDPKTGKLLYSHETAVKGIGWFGTLLDAEGRIWFVNGGVRRFDPRTRSLKAFKGINPREDFKQANPLSLTISGDGRIWAGTWDGGVWRFVPEMDDFTRHPSPNGYMPVVFAGHSDFGKNLLWVGGGKTGLAFFDLDKGTYSELRNDVRDSYTHNNYQARHFYEDPSNGDIWIGTEIGLERYAPSSLRFGRAIIPKDKDVGVFNLVSGVAKDNTDPTGNRYFIGVWGTGLYAWHRNEGRFERMNSGKSVFAGNGIFNIFQSRNGMLWGCTGYGVSNYNPRTGQWKDYKNFYKDNTKNLLVWYGLEDKKGNLWFGTMREGLYRYNPLTDQMEQAFYAHGFANSKGNLTIVNLSEDAKGRIWMACADMGLIRFDPATGKAKRFNFKDTNSFEGCKAVRVGANGKVYAAFHNTFFELDENGQELRRYTQENGLQTGHVMFLAEDKTGKIWFTSEYLLHCFDPQTGKFSYYGKGDGLFSNAMTDAFSVTEDGEFFIGFQSAINFFRPELLRKNTIPPPVAITAIKVMNKERELRTRTQLNLDIGLFSNKLKNVQQDTFLTLNPGEDFFEVEFAALNFNQPERNQYAYMLENFNEEWIYTDRPVATFTNLNGGRYKLHMKAANNDGVWNEEGTTLDILVTPPFYKRWWFRLLVLGLLGGLVFGFIKYRQYQRDRLDRFREGLARDLHDEMGSTLSSIRFFSEFAKQQIGEEQPTVTPVLHRISESASSLSESMQDIIWAMKTKNDQLEDLAARMTEFGLRLLEARNMRFVTHVNEDFSGKNLKPEVRRNVYLIFKEAVNNAAKYAEASEVQLFLALKNGLLVLKITDNGKGFELGQAASSGGGNGLQNMRQRAEDIGGKVEIHSSPGVGTSVELRVRV